MLSRGYANLITTHCNAAVLDEVRDHLPDAQKNRVLLVVDDVTCPAHLFELDPVLLWHDQHLLPELAVPAQRDTYRRLLRYMVGVGGWVLLGLGPVTALDEDAAESPYKAAVVALADFLGRRYTLRHVFAAEATQPTQGYALFERSDTEVREQWSPH